MLCFLFKTETMDRREEEEKAEAFVKNVCDFEPEEADEGFGTSIAVFRAIREGEIGDQCTPEEVKNILNIAKQLVREKERTPHHKAIMRGINRYIKERGKKPTGRIATPSFVSSKMGKTVFSFFLFVCIYNI